MINDVKITEIDRDIECQIVTDVTEFRIDCVSLIRTIMFSIKHNEHAKQQKIYEQSIMELCEKKMESVISVKITHTDYADMAEIIFEITDFYELIFETFESIKRQPVLLIKYNCSNNH